MQEDKFKSFTARQMNKFLCLQAIVVFIAGVIVNASENPSALTHIPVYVLMLAYIYIEYVFIELRGFKQYAYYVVQCVTLVIILLSIPHAAWFVISALGTVLLVHATILFRNKFLVFAGFIIIYVLIHILFRQLDAWVISKKFLMAFPIIIVAISSYLIIVKMNNDDKREYLQKLENSHKEIVMLAQMSERERMARDFHDTFAQGIVSLIMQLEVADIHLSNNNHEKIQQILENSRKQAMKLVEDSKKVSTDLELTSDNGLEFISKLNEEIKSIKSMRKIDITCEVDEKRISAMSNVVRRNLIFIVKESLRNAAKHSEASIVNILIEGSHKELTVKIIDNGVGFDRDSLTGKSKRYGLVGIKERAEIIGGQLQIISERGKGTTIHITITTQ